MANGENFGQRTWEGVKGVVLGGAVILGALYFLPDAAGAIAEKWGESSIFGMQESTHAAVAGLNIPGV